MRLPRRTFGTRSRVAISLAQRLFDTTCSRLVIRPGTNARNMFVSHHSSTERIFGIYLYTYISASFVRRRMFGTRFNFTANEYCSDVYSYSFGVGNVSTSGGVENPANLHQTMDLHHVGTPPLDVCIGDILLCTTTPNSGPLSD